jgi:hypothetical protein
MTEQHPDGLTGHDPADPTTPTSVADVEADAMRTPDGAPDGELIDPATLPRVEPGGDDDESSEAVRSA